ncbi:MAG: RHS repeat-associated core domain-containing protein [Terrimicrobiaceae bacterium]|nr:RHS repeat-associated core domain-containing protein [Terrimicrobiaceae bacterium]
MKYHTATASSGYASATSPASTEATAYDAAGNRSSQTIGATTTSYTVNDLNQYTQAGGCNPTYDGCGNMNLYNPDGNDDWDLTYSPFGQLIGAESPDFQISYAYDAFGNRAYEKSNGVYSRKLLHVGSQLLDCYETPSGGGSAITKSYVYGPGIDHPICEITGNAATTKYLLQDANANVVALISAAGAVTERYTYDAWGKPTVHDASWTVQSSAPQSRFLFTGRDYDVETGLYHYRSRAYSPKIGRFLQPDTIDFNGGDLNIYSYVANNPVHWIDPLGLSPQSQANAMAAGAATGFILSLPVDALEDFFSGGVGAIANPATTAAFASAGAAAGSLFDNLVNQMSGNGQGSGNYQPGKKGDNTAQNKKANDACKKAGLNKDQMETFHDIPGKEDMSFDELYNTALDVKAEIY